MKLIYQIIVLWLVEKPYDLRMDFSVIIENIQAEAQGESLWLDAGRIHIDSKSAFEERA